MKVRYMTSVVALGRAFVLWLPGEYELPFVPLPGMALYIGDAQVMVSSSGWDEEQKVLFVWDKGEITPWRGSALLGLLLTYQDEGWEPRRGTWEDVFRACS